MKKAKNIGILIGFIGFVLAWLFFGWKLVLVLMVVMWGNNVEQKFSK